MRRLTWMVCAGVVASTVVVPRAQDLQGPAAIRPDEWPTFRAGTRLATIDAVVVDDSGPSGHRPEAVRLRDRRARRETQVHQALYVRVGVPAERRPCRCAPAGAQPPHARAAGDAWPPAPSRRPGACRRRQPARARHRRRRPRPVVREHRLRPHDVDALRRHAGRARRSRRHHPHRRRRRHAAAVHDRPPAAHAAIDRVRCSFQSRSGVVGLRGRHARVEHDGVHEAARSGPAEPPPPFGVDVERERSRPGGRRLARRARV